MLQLGRQEPRLCAITAAMPAGTGLTAFEAAYPNRTFDVGIAEQHAVSMAAGMARGGYRPYFAVYSTFLQRASIRLCMTSACRICRCASCRIMSGWLATMARRTTAF